MDDVIFHNIINSWAYNLGHLAIVLFNDYMKYT